MIITFHFTKKRLRPVQTYPDVFEFCSGFKKKYASTRSVFESFSPVHTKPLKRWKYNSIS